MFLRIDASFRLADKYCCLQGGAEFGADAKFHVMLRTLARLTTPCLILGFLISMPDVATATSLVTDVTYVGERLWYSVSLDGNWTYELGETEKGIKIQRSTVSEKGWSRRHSIIVSEKEPFDTWPEEHTVEWAADAYRQWEKQYMITEGVKKGLYDLENVETGEKDLYGRHFYTFTYKQTFDDPKARNLEMRSYLYLYFPDDYEAGPSFYWLHYSELRHKKDREPLSLAQFHDVVEAFSLVRNTAPRESSVSWSGTGDHDILLSALGQQRTYYFNSNSDRQCFSFSVDGKWFPTSEPGLIISPDKRSHVGALLLSEDELKDFEGDDLLARAVDCQQKNMEQQQGGKAENSVLGGFAGRFPNTVRWSADWQVKLNGQKFMIRAVRYLAEVRPGWIAIITSSHGAGGDDMADTMFDSLKFSDEPSCFDEDVAALKR